MIIVCLLISIRCQAIALKKDVGVITPRLYGIEDQNDATKGQLQELGRQLKSMRWAIDEQGDSPPPMAPIIIHENTPEPCEPNESFGLGLRQDDPFDGSVFDDGSYYTDPSPLDEDEL